LISFTLRLSLRILEGLEDLREGSYSYCNMFGADSIDSCGRKFWQCWCIRKLLTVAVWLFNSDCLVFFWKTVRQIKTQSEPRKSVSVFSIHLSHNSTQMTPAGNTYCMFRCHNKSTLLLHSRPSSSRSPPSKRSKEMIDGWVVILRLLWLTVA
jgi:hypothetical protein